MTDYKRLAKTAENVASEIERGVLKPGILETWTENGDPNDVMGHVRFRAFGARPTLIEVDTSAVVYANDRKDWNGVVFALRRFAQECEGYDDAK